MATLIDLIKQQVSAATGNLDIPENAKEQVMGGLTDSVFGRRR